MLIIIKSKEGVPDGHPLLLLPVYLLFGLAFGAAFLPALGAAFLALAFVAISVRCFSPSHRSGTLSPEKIFIQSACLYKYIIIYN